MAVNWGLVGQGFNALDVLQSAGQARKEKYAWDKLERDEAAAQQSAQVRQRVAGDVAQGRYGEAANYAAGAGDFDLAKQIQGLGADQQKRLAEELKVAGGAAAGLRALPQAQRMAALQQYRPALNAAGLDDNEIARYIGDLSDGVLDGIVNTVSTAEQVFSRNEPKWQAIGEGGIVNVRDPAAIAAYQGRQAAPAAGGDLEAQAAAAIAAGADPAAVRARMQQMQGGAGGSQRGFPGPVQGTGRGY